MITRVCLALVVVVSGLGCKQNVGGESTRSYISVAPDASTSHSPRSEPVAPGADAGTAVAQLSHAALIDLALDEEIMRRTPDDTAARFASAGQLERSSVVPDRLQLSTKNEEYALRISYVQDARWIFQAAFIELYPRHPVTLEALYKAVDDVMKEKLGRAKSVEKEGNGPPRKTYRLGKELFAFLSERTSQGRSVVFVEVSAPEAAGD